MKYLFIPLLSATIILFSILSNIYDIRLYESSYQRHEVYRRFEISYAKQKVESIFGYLKGQGELDANFFSEEEVSHLDDVKRLIGILTLIFLACIVILSFLSVKLMKAPLYSIRNCITAAGALNLVIVVSFSVIYLIFGFDLVFDRFHFTFFADNYAFDPRVSNMINLFPQYYFLEVALRMVVTMIAASLAFIGAANYSLLKRMTR